jgi:hypothetical protein
VGDTRAAVGAEGERGFVDAGAARTSHKDPERSSIGGSEAGTASVSNHHD